MDWQKATGDWFRVLPEGRYLLFNPRRDKGLSGEMSDFEHQVNWGTGASGESRSDYHEHSGEQQIPDNFIGDEAVYALRKVAGDLRARLLPV